MEVTKSKSGSMPGRYASSSPNRGGFPDTFLHTNSPTRNYQPKYQYEQEQAQPSPEPKESTKKWTFGGLFRRKDKDKVSEKVKSPSIPITIQFEPSQRPLSQPGKGTGPGVLISSGSDSSDETESNKHQNFLRKKLSSGKTKKSGLKGLLKVPQGRKMAGGSPDFQNRSVQSWETTKKVPPMVLNGAQTYSSSGSLSLSMEGSSSLSRGSRVAARDAMVSPKKITRISCKLTHKF